MTDDDLVAYVDGELSGDALHRLETALVADPALRRRADELTAQREHLQAAFAGTIDEPVPKRLRNAALTAPVSVQMRLREYLGGWSAGSLLRLAAVATAALLIGLGIGRFSNDNGLVGSANGTMVARGALAQALETKLASEATNGLARVGVSFRDRSNAYCRTFSSAGSAGVACKGKDGWRIAALAESEEESAGQYQAAGSAMPDTIRDTVNRMIEGQPLDAPEERRARDRGWK